MRRAIVGAALGLAAITAGAQEGGMITRPSNHSVAETATRLESAIVASGTYKVFFRMDHAENAQKEAGATIPPSQLILFGNPKGGAPLMKESPTIALDLPNRALIWQDASGKVWVTYNDIGSLLARHGIKRSEEQVKVIEARQKVLFDKAAD